MNFSEYHERIKASVLPSYPDYGNDLRYPAMGAADEAGELLGKVKKLWRDRNCTTMVDLQLYLQVDEAAAVRQAMIKEVGDVLWYLDAMATTLGTTLEACAEANVVKLTGRIERGTTARSGDDR